MNRFVGLAISVATFCATAAGAANSASVIYGSAFTGTGTGAASTLYTISPTTGAATFVGGIGFTQVGAMAFDSKGTLWGIGKAGQTWVLITINPATGAGTQVGPLGDITLQSVEDMDFRPSDGKLFMLGSTNTTSDVLYTLNLTQGTATRVGQGNSSFITDGDGLAFSSGNVLYNVNQLELEVTNQANGTRTRAVILNYNSLFGNATPPTRANAMKFDPQTGTLWASVANGPTPTDNTNAIGVIDPGSGNVAYIGPTVHGLDAIAISSPAALTSMAHAADGNNFKTAVLLTNATTTAAAYSLKFDDDLGNVPALGFQLEAGALTGTVPGGLSTTIRTSGLGPQTFGGWGEMIAPRSIAGSVIYSQKTNLPSVQEGTTSFGAVLSQDFFAAFDNTGGAITSMAVTDPGLVTALINVTLRYSDGTAETVPLPSIPGRNHQAFAMTTLFPNSAGKAGVAEFVSTSSLNVVVFRFNSTGAFTALDAVPASTNNAVVIRTLAHAADGNNFKTTVLLTNAGTAPANYTLKFFDDTGSIPTAGFQLEAGSLIGQIPPGQSATIRTAGLGTQTFGGWATLSAPASVAGSVIYSQKTSLPSIQEGTVSIGALPSQDTFVPFDNTANAMTSVALTNPGNVDSGQITVFLRYNDGGSETIPYPSLAAGTHTAFVVPTAFGHSANRTGVAEFVSATPLSIVDFRFNSTGAFTALGTVTH